MSIRSSIDSLLTPIEEPKIFRRFRTSFQDPTMESDYTTGRKNELPLQVIKFVILIFLVLEIAAIIRYILHLCLEDYQYPWWWCLVYPFCVGFSISIYFLTKIYPKHHNKWGVIIISWFYLIITELNLIDEQSMTVLILYIIYIYIYIIAYLDFSHY